MRTFFAYHLTHVFGPFDPRAYYTNSGQPKVGDHVYVVSGDDAKSGGKDYYLEGLLRIDKRDSGGYTLTAVSGENKVFDHRLRLAAVRRPRTPIPMSHAAWYDPADIHRYFSSGQNFNPLPSGYRERFEELLAAFQLGESDELTDDLLELQRDAVPETQRAALVLARVGQGKFRSDVMKLWELRETCSLTSLELPELIIASHIKPWRESDNRERLDPHNGLLLAAHVDRLFDRFLITFESVNREFRLKINPRIRAVASRLSLRDGMKLNSAYISTSSVEQIDAYLAFHRSAFEFRIASESLPLASKR